MPRVTLVALALALAATAMLAATAYGHEGEDLEAIVVEPASVSVGGTVLLVGTNLEPDTPRVLLLRGEDLIVELGSETTTADGRFKREIVIPDYLPAGVYQLQAIGDETLTAELQVVGGSGSSTQAAAVQDAEEAGPRSRGGLELSLIILFAGLVTVMGVVLVVRAERIGRALA
ncbi:MAG: hypothetical protein ACC726_09280 [Chloroflexota bacterium]